MEQIHPILLSRAIAPWVNNTRWYRGGVFEPNKASGTLVGLCATQEEQPAYLFWLIAEGYNIPLVLREEHDAEAAKQREGSVGSLGIWSITDATGDFIGQCALYELSYRGGGNFRATPHTPEHTIHSAHSLSSEQSNTSIIYECDDSSKVILKVFRTFSVGANPDVELQGALASTGIVPLPYTSASLMTEEGEGDVLVVQEFLEDACDAWQVITSSLKVCDGSLGLLEPRIVNLGAITRQMHENLARTCGYAEANSKYRAPILLSWEARAEAAFSYVPSLGVHAKSIQEYYRREANEESWPSFQRIHGDYHLGQVVDVPGRGWRILDFEGEPLRPLSERVRPDVALRDVAGMVRSFDYAAGSALIAGGDAHALASWNAHAVEAFMRGYGDLSPAELRLLNAFILDKALYEVTYEATSRPSWLSIPVAGVRRLLENL